jgi:hypothetical protein
MMDSSFMCLALIRAPHPLAVGWGGKGPPDPESS